MLELLLLILCPFSAEHVGKAPLIGNYAMMAVYHPEVRWRPIKIFSALPTASREFKYGRGGKLRPYTRRLAVKKGRGEPM
jgi:hypothetical protein